MNDSIQKVKVFNHPIQKVWDAISRGEELSTWFINADFKPQVGYQYTFTASEENNCTQITGEVLQANPYTLSYTWVVADTNVRTVVTWELSETDEGTQLKLAHTGIAGYDKDTAIAMFESFSKGWQNCINSLVDHLKATVNAG